MKTDKNTAQYLVTLLESYGVEYIFGYPGEQVISIYEALRESSIKHVLTRHEQGAVHAADCYARATGKYGVCLSTAGPGAMNLVMGVSTCYKDNIPLLVITGDVSTDVKGEDTFQDLDLNAVFKPICIKSYFAHSPEKLENSINEAFLHFEEGITGPVHINIPKNIQKRDVNQHHKVIHTRKVKSPTDDAVRKIIENIESSRKPLIIAGTGVLFSDSVNELKEFIKKTGIPLTTTWNARGIISEKDEDNFGLIGSRSSPRTKYAAENSDLVLALGTRLSDRSIRNINTSNIMQVNTKPEHARVDEFYNYNVKELLGKLNKNEINVDAGKWKKRIKSKDANVKYEVKKTDKLHPRKVVKNILKHMNENITLLIDAGTTPTYFTIDSTIEKYSQILFSGGLGPMGYAVPGAIGASFARPDDVIIAVTGDGSIQMTLEELAVIKTYKLPIIIIVINNNLLGIIKQWQDMADLPPYQVKLDNPDFIKLAEAYGIRAENVTSINDLNNKLTQAIREKKACLFNVDVADVHVPLA